MPRVYKNRERRMGPARASSLSASESVLRRYGVVGLTVFDVVMGELIRANLPDEAAWLNDNVKWILESLARLEIESGGDDGVS